MNTLPAKYREWAKSTIVAGTVREVINYYRRIVEAGAQYLIAGFLYQDADQTTVRLLAPKVMPEVQPQ